MDYQISILGLQRARELVEAGEYAGIPEAISSLKNVVNGPKRDLAYYAVLETARASSGEAGMSVLASASREAAMALLDATIKRMMSKLH